jgi:outer membrane protein OmpA-like peptidoglycan-associated protein
MNKSLLWLYGLLGLLWLFLGSFFSNKYCNCSKAAAVPAVVAPAVGSSEKATKAILIADQEKNFKAGVNDNLLFGLSTCDYETPLTAPLTTVFQQTADYLKKNPNRILNLTGLYLGTEKNECQGAKDLGYGRAEKVKTLLTGMGAPANQIRVLSNQTKVAMYEGKVLGGVLYEFISGETSDVEKRLRMGNITLYFESNKQQIALTADQQKYFDDLKYFISQKPDAKITVHGHTDNRSNLKYNLRLSRKRAEFVRDFMVQNGIPKKNIIAEGKGPNIPVATNDSDEGRAKNRRVEVKIQ